MKKKRMKEKRNKANIAELAIIAAVVSAVVMSNPSITGMLTGSAEELPLIPGKEFLSEREYQNYFRFRAAFSGDLWESGSWAAGGFEDAAFYVDVGLMKAFVKQEWCPGVLKDWKQYHDFEIEIDKLSDRTVFLVDGEPFCSIQSVPETSRVFLSAGNSKSVSMAVASARAG